MSANRPPLSIDTNPGVEGEPSEPSDSDQNFMTLWSQALILNMRMRKHSSDDEISLFADGSMDFVQDQLAGFCGRDVFPIDAPALRARLKKASDANKLSTCVPALRNIFTAASDDNLDGAAVCYAVQEFYKHLNSFITSQPTTPVKVTFRPRDFSNPIFEDLVDHWNKDYVGPSCETLIEKLRIYEKSFSNNFGRKYYAKTIAFTQSSGAGKSRLANEFGQHCPLVFFVLREPGTGFPPADVQVYEFMRSNPGADIQEVIRSPKSSLVDSKKDIRADFIWVHSLAIGLLQATFEICNQYVKGFQSKYEDRPLLADLAKSIRGYFRLSKHPLPEKPLSAEFDERVAERAQLVCTQCVRDSEFRALFTASDEDSSLRKRLEESTCEPLNRLRTTVTELEDTLRNFAREDPNDPLFTIVFDEVASLLGKDGQNARFIALNRMMSVISENHYVWGFFLSTESVLVDLLPPDQPCQRLAPQHQPSSRIISGGQGQRLIRFPPFTAFAVDIQDLLNNFKIRPNEEAMTDFSTVAHMKRFGRPLWQIYDNPLSIAASKLLGGGQLQYNALDRDHVFAILSMRLCLDVNLANPITLPLSRTAVHLHMRVVKSLEPGTGHLFTKTPFEPVLALASCRHLHTAVAWPQTIRTFASELLSLGAIDKGSKGELFARLVLTLARDCGVPEDHPLRKREQAVESLPILTVKSFLRELLAEQYHEDLDTIDPEILDAYINFVMFTKTSEHLTNESFFSLCHSLLRRSAALQLALRQPKYDLLIPFYWGDAGKPYEQAKAGAIVVQIKNRGEKSSPRQLLGESFYPTEKPTQEPKQKRQKTRKSSALKKTTSFIFTHGKIKLLYLLLDIGTEKPSVEVSCTRGVWPKMWAIHCTGHDERIFRCIQELRCQEHTREFFNDLMKSSGEENIAFHHDSDILDNVLHHDQYDWSD